MTIIYTIIGTTDNPDPEIKKEIESISLDQSYGIFYPAIYYYPVISRVADRNPQRRNHTMLRV